MAAATISGVGLAASACAWFACFNRSGIATTEASAVSLITLMELAVSGGMTMRIACGRITLRMVGQQCKPSARAASNWPVGIASMPARTISAE